VRADADAVDEHGTREIGAKPERVHL